MLTTFFNLTNIYIYIFLSTGLKSSPRVDVLRETCRSFSLPEVAAILGALHFRSWVHSSMRAESEKPCVGLLTRKKLNKLTDISRVDSLFGMIRNICTSQKRTIHMNLRSLSQFFWGPKPMEPLKCWNEKPTRSEVATSPLQKKTAFALKGSSLENNETIWTFLELSLGWS